jgi:hypothetical protein
MYHVTRELYSQAYAPLAVSIVYFGSVHTYINITAMVLRRMKVIKEDFPYHHFSLYNAVTKW